MAPRRSFPATVVFRQNRFSTIFGRTDLRISLSGAIFCVEFDGGAHFSVAPPKSTVLQAFHFLFKFSSKITFFRREAAGVAVHAVADGHNTRGSPRFTTLAVTLYHKVY